jgi:hypothetical protein
MTFCLPDKLCRWIVSTNLVEESCRRILSTNLVDESCRQILSTNLVNESCQRILLMNKVDESCWPILLTNSVDKYCWRIVSMNCVNESCRRILSTNFVDDEMPWRVKFVQVHQKIFSPPFLKKYVINLNVKVIIFPSERKGAFILLLNVAVKHFLKQWHEATLSAFISTKILPFITHT